MTWASRATRRQPFPTVRFSSAPTGTSTASRRTKIRGCLQNEKRTISALHHDGRFAFLSLWLAVQCESRSERTKQFVTLLQYLSPRLKPSLEPTVCGVLSPTDIDVSCCW